MNLLEIKYLTSKELSHIARSLYTFYLRPNAEKNINKIDLNDVTNYLVTDSKYFKTTPNLEIASLCLDELEQIGLISREATTSWHGAFFTLPYYVNETNELPSTPFKMTTSWKPSANFNKVCIMCGLEDPSYTNTQLQSFRSYWAGRTEERNQSAWERAFAIRLLKSHEEKIYKKKNQSSKIIDTNDNLNITKPAVLNITDEKIEEDLKNLNDLFKKE